MAGSIGEAILQADPQAEIKRLRHELAQRNHLLACLATKLGGVVLLRADLEREASMSLATFPDGSIALVPVAQAQSAPLVVVPRVQVR